MEKSSVSKATLGRLPCYLQFLKELLDNNNKYVSSTAIAKALSLGEVQVRKDLNVVSGAGRPKVGYVVEDLIDSIEKTLGCKHLTKAVIVGAGMLGQALLNFEGFADYGVEIAAAFDLVEKKADKTHKAVYPMSSFESYCKTNHIKIGIITVNEKAAQDVCDLMVKNNIKAVWNFSLKKLNVAENIWVQQENLALSLAHLNNKLINKIMEE